MEAVSDVNYDESKLTFVNVTAEQSISSAITRYRRAGSTIVARNLAPLALRHFSLHLRSFPASYYTNADASCSCLYQGLF